ncbi:hypothetical protein Hanom_Chr01g00012731 [Helianthus anomalus]
MFTDPEIQNLKSCFPLETIFRSFDPSVQSDTVSETWICFPALPFLLGFSYPFPSYTQSFLDNSLMYECLLTYECLCNP